MNDEIYFINIKKTHILFLFGVFIDTSKNGQGQKSYQRKISFLFKWLAASSSTRCIFLTMHWRSVGFFFFSVFFKHDWQIRSTARKRNEALCSEVDQPQIKKQHAKRKKPDTQEAKTKKGFIITSAWVLQELGVVTNANRNVA